MSASTPPHGAIGMGRLAELFSEETLREQAVLIVDDSQVTQVMLRKALEREGFSRVITEGDPWRVLDVVAEHDPAVLILDAEMPELDGFGVLQLLAKELGPLGQPPVLLLVGEMTDEITSRALAAGVVDLLARPIKPGLVTVRVRSAVYRRLLERRVGAGNSALQDLVDARTRELDNAQVEILDRLALAGDYRDDSSGEHGRRVGHLAGDIARALGLSAGVAEMIRRAAPLHDIGKIAIPDSIVLKPGPLEAEEMAVMKTHTTIGGRILAGNHPVLWLASQIALTHHERWDGSGYPESLVGEDIPLPGRIVAVADVFDVLTQVRPYRPAWPRHKAIGEVLAQSGHQFDPRVVGAFLGVANAR
ncbi:MAG TPA: HD domain-containing phosphohydrolase [Candidatus Dormibacteraeota bacterium]|nr:HD domain-containing phosphohydrolase [Candidatus Dormibacteraeota bacterium]